MNWQATVTWTATDPSGVNLDDILDALTDALADRDASIGPEGDLYVAVLTVNAGTIRQASSIAISAVVAAAAAARQSKVIPQGIEVITEAEAERRISTPVIPDVVDSKSAAEILGVSKQRVQQLSASDSRFPVPLLVVSGSPVWGKDAMLAYAERRDPRPGRPAKAG